MKKHILSKSTFMRGCQCQKSLYLYKYNPELKDEISASQQAIFDTGHNIGVLAQGLFPNGVNAEPLTPFEYQKSVLETAEYIKQSKQIIYEAAFQTKDGVLSAIDILVKENGNWKAFEVKSSTSVSDTYKLDAALQYYVISNSGIELEDISIVHINNEYERIGELEINQLFKIESVIEEVKGLQGFVKNKISELNSAE